MITRSSIESATPILIGGMHRAGTSLLVKLLREEYLHIGHDLDPNKESLLFLRWNEWLLEQTGNRWDHPATFSKNIMPLQHNAVAQLRMALETAPARKAFWGKQLHPPHFTNHAPPWGWKDPRNTFTFPIWQKVFPQARIVLITRHGVDVAQSLTTRARHEMGQWRATKTPPPHRLITGSARCLTLEGAFSLWEEYQTAIGNLHKTAPTASYVLKYENLISDPVTTMERICTFCKCPNLARARQYPELDNQRVHAYRQNPDLTDFAQAHKHRLQAFGYEA